MTVDLCIRVLSLSLAAENVRQTASIVDVAGLCLCGTFTIPFSLGLGGEWLELLPISVICCLLAHSQEDIKCP